MDLSAQKQPLLPLKDNHPCSSVNAPCDAKNDWTQNLADTDHIRLFRETDWTRNGLGPLKDWDTTLQLFANFVFADSRAACLWWGPEYVAVYNDAFAPLCHGVHPTLMGSTYAEGFPEIWPYIRAMFEQSVKTGTGQNVTSDAPLLVERNGWKEEAFFSGSFVPIGPRDHPLGFYNSVFEVTDQKLADRRTSMLNKLSAVPAQTIDAVTEHVLAMLATNGNDVPLAMLYKVKVGTEPATLQLQGQIGLPEGHRLLVDAAEMSCDKGLIPDLRCAGSEPYFIDYDERFDSVSWHGWGAPSKKIAILPITSLGRVFGYLVIGSNPYRPFDDACRQFARDLSRMVSTLFTAAVNFELAENHREQLESELAFSNLRLRHLVEHASVGMCHASIDGNMLWANEHYFRLMGSTADEHAEKYSFYNVYLKEDLPQVEAVWNDLVSGVEHVSVEFRLKRMFTAPTGEEIPATIQVLAFPYRDSESGRVKSVMSCATDISRLKWAETFQTRSATEAREARKQQEAFIDVVSHEMRNPLGAIMHCADAIIAMKNDRKDAEVAAEHPEALAETMQNAKIILQCAQHQRRILDDVLTLSKLNSTLISITPAIVEPPSLISSMIGMFEAQLDSYSIRCKVNADPSISDLAITQVYLDPSRVTQIFINLLTNAIKFVKASKNPFITIRYGACLLDPRSFFPDNMVWADGKPCVDMSDSEWGSGEHLFLNFIVQDSGIGINHDDVARIFQRFSQANIKTSVTYGGSGLGLYISKELAEKQGGEIGVTSVPGQGATFGFYVKARRREEERTLLKNPVSREVPHQMPNHIRVLLVEDNIINQQVLSKQLRRTGCTVDVANHGREALQILEEKTFDVVLMDSEMPILDGLSATRLIRQKELQGEGLLGLAVVQGTRARKQLPIIAVTANVRDEQIKAAIKAGSNEVVQKPFKVQDLIDRIRILIL